MLHGASPAETGFAAPMLTQVSTCNSGLLLFLGGGVHAENFRKLILKASTEN